MWDLGVWDDFSQFKVLCYHSDVWVFLFCRYGALSFGEVVSFVPQKLDKVKMASVRRLAVREAVKVCSFICFCFFL